MAANILTDVIFWIILTFTMIGIIILMFVLIFIIKIKTHAFEELKAFIKKCPVNIFLEDGRLMDMKAIRPDGGVIVDKDYGAFLPNMTCSYLSKRTRGIYNLFDASFSPGISIAAANAAKVLHDACYDESDFQKIGDAINDGTLKDESLECIKTNVYVGHLKQLYACLEPHAINASIEKKVTQKMHSTSKGGGTTMLWMFLAGLGGVVAAFILLKIFGNMG